MHDKVNQELTEFVECTGRRPGEWRPDWEAAYNLAPTDDIPVLVEDGRDGHLRFERAYWSLVPPGSPTKKAKNTFNARAETAVSQSRRRAPLRSRRLVVFAYL